MGEEEDTDPRGKREDVTTYKLRALSEDVRDIKKEHKDFDHRIDVVETHVAHKASSRQIWLVLGASIFAFAAQPIIFWRDATLIHDRHENQLNALRLKINEMTLPPGNEIGRLNQRISDLETTVERLKQGKKGG